MHYTGCYDFPMPQPRKYKTIAERQRAYRMRHGLFKMVPVTVLDDLRQEVIRRKEKVAQTKRGPDQFLSLLELLSFIQRELTTLSGPAPAKVE
jgi:hypothetical protein